VGGINICIAIESFFDGGAEMFAIRLANELTKNHKVFFLELEPYRSSEKRQKLLLNANGLHCIQAGKNWLGEWLYGQNKVNRKTGRVVNALKAFYFAAKKRQIIKIISNNEISVVNSHSWDTDVYFAACKLIVPFRLVSTFHGHYEFLKDKRADFDVDTLQTLQLVDVVVYTTNMHLKTLDYYRVPTSRRYKIFYGNTMRQTEKVTKYLPVEVFKIVMVARGIREKGWEEAIKAVLQLKWEQQLNVQLIMVGEGQYLDVLQEKYQDPDLIYLGYKENVKEIIESAHIGLLPTYYIAESLPNTVIEYLFCGKPVISTNIGAIPEMLLSTQGQAGICLEAGGKAPAINQLAAAIKGYIDNPELIKEHSERALLAAKKFTMKTCVREYEFLYVDKEVA